MDFVLDACDVKPQGGSALLQGHHTHYLCHFVILHDGEIVEWLIEEQCESGGRRSTDPLNVQASCGGLLRTTIICCFDLKREAQKGSQKNSHGHALTFV